VQPEEIQTISTFRNAKGQNIFYRNWKIRGTPKGIVVIVHGLNSHSGYYQNFAIQLRENSFEVYAMDLPGRGQSDGERYYIADYRDIISDISQLVEITKSAFPVLPVFLFGHSAGGVFVSVYCLRNQHRVAGLIAESFAFQLPAPRFALAIVKLLSHIIPHTSLVRLKNEDFSRDKSIVQMMNNDPLLTNERQPAKTMQQLFLADEHLKREMAQIKLPLLILHGTGDKVTKFEGSQYYNDYAASVDKQLKLYEGHYHDLLNDKYNGTIVRDILRWLNDRT
jgi:acylglycerol lipase